jgi:hypothetical protein
MAPFTNRDGQMKIIFLAVILTIGTIVWPTLVGHNKTKRVHRVF